MSDSQSQNKGIIVDNGDEIKGVGSNGIGMDDRNKVCDRSNNNQQQQNGVQNNNLIENNELTKIKKSVTTNLKINLSKKEYDI